MSGVSDLQAAVAAMQTSITASIAAQELILTEIQNLKANGGLSDADAETLATSVNASVAALQGETTKDGQN